MIRNLVFILNVWLVHSLGDYRQPPRGTPVWGYFSPPVLQRVPPQQEEQSPMDAMVDVTNNLGVAILRDHSYSRGNFAFSPYGVASVLVVLYEGSRGESARQIHRAVKFPADKERIRVGFRDMHRHLRSYFSHEGYLSGITLNKEGSTLKPEYKKVLRFYGYDVEFNQVLLEDNEADLGNVTTPATEVASSPTTKGSTGSPTAKPENGMTENQQSEEDSRETTTVSQEETTKVSLQDSSEERRNDTEDRTTTTSEVVTSTKESTTVSEVPPTTTVGVEAAEINETEAERKPNLDNGMLIPQPEDRGEPATTESSRGETDFAPTLPEVADETTTQTIGKRSSPAEAEKKMRALLLGNAVDTRNGIKVNLTKTRDPHFMGKIRQIVDSKVPLWLNHRPRRRARTITDYLKSPNNPELSLQLQNGMYDTHVSRNSHLYRSLPRLLFLVDGGVDTPVPMMTHTNVFPYVYIPRLHTKALEFPLDDVRYKLLILLPVERRGLRQLMYDLADFPLRNIFQSLRMSRVKVTVPTFMVEGFVILTSSLQKLGVWDVFDPRKSNLSGMSTDPELYVRNVEQSVTVVIRNYVEILDIQTRTMAARHLEQEFEATHPFLYFVLDTATNVALMAGQMLDPLNSRIY